MQTNKAKVRSLIISLHCFPNNNELLHELSLNTTQDHAVWLLSCSNSKYQLIDALLVSHQVSPKTFEQNITTFPLTIVDKRIKKMIQVSNTAPTLWRAANLYESISKAVEKTMSHRSFRLQRRLKSRMEHRALHCVLSCLNNRHEIDEKSLIIKCITLLNRCPDTLNYTFDGHTFSKTDELAQYLAEYLLEKLPNDDQSWYLLASVHYRSGRFVKALQCYEQAILKNPGQLVYQHQYRNVLHQLEMYRPHLKSIAGSEIFALGETAELKWTKFCQQYGLPVNNNKSNLAIE
jgi:tetratricopeptide (TPR) repeat protein